MSGQVGAGVRAERVEGLRDVRCGWNGESARRLRSRAWAEWSNMQQGRFQIGRANGLRAKRDSGEVFSRGGGALQEGVRCGLGGSGFFAAGRREERAVNVGGSRGLSGG